MAVLKQMLKALEQDMQIILQEAPVMIQAEEIQALLVDQCSSVGGMVADLTTKPTISTEIESGQPNHLVTASLFLPYECVFQSPAICR
jgi:hypothetical protein